MMPLCGVTKQWNSLICYNILAETSVKTHFHKRSWEPHLLKAEQDFYSHSETKEVSVHRHLHKPFVVSIFTLSLVSVRPQNGGITTLRSASSCTHDSSFSA